MFPWLHTIAAGKCILAGESESDLKAYVKQGLPASTEHTITSPARLAEELRRVRELGYAMGREEAVPGIGGVAVPLYDRERRVIAALALAFFTSEMTERNINSWLEQLRVGARVVSRVLAAARMVREPGDRGWPQ